MLASLRAHAGVLLTLSRPRMLPYLLLLVLGGYGWAHWDRALVARGVGEVGLVLLAWVLLNAGTLWLNARLDQDEGEVLFGESVAVPEWIGLPGYGALLASVGLAWLADPISGLAATACALLAVLYSLPRAPWKGHPLLGPLTNLLGYGLLSPLAGWAVVDVTPDPRTLVVWALGAVGVLGIYFLAQAFQQQEDAARGYRTLVVTHGPRVTILTGGALLLVPLLGGVVLAVIGWLPRICLVALPLAGWIAAWIERWARQPGGGDGRWAREATRRLLVSSLITLALNLGWYGWECVTGSPVAGLNTAAGLPPDRPAWPPAAMRAWEQAQASKQRARPPAEEM